MLVKLTKLSTCTFTLFLLSSIQNSRDPQALGLCQAHANSSESGANTFQIHASKNSQHATSLRDQNRERDRGGSVLVRGYFRKYVDSPFFGLILELAIFFFFVLLFVLVVIVLIGITTTFAEEDEDNQHGIVQREFGISERLLL